MTILSSAFRSALYNLTVVETLALSVALAEIIMMMLQRGINRNSCKWVTHTCTFVVQGIELSGEVGPIHTVYTVDSFFVASEICEHFSSSHSSRVFPVVYRYVASVT